MSILKDDYLKFVVGGTWRGGTNYIRNVLDELGVDCTHEYVFQSAYMNNDYMPTAEVSPALACHVDTVNFLEIPVVQLIRPKADVIASMERWGGPITGDIGKYWEETHIELARMNPFTVIDLSAPMRGILAIGWRFDYDWSEDEVQEALDEAEKCTYEQKNQGTS
jgi:hypothetical protein